MSSFIGKFLLSYPFNSTKTLLFIADAASEKKNVFNPNSSILSFETILDLFG